MSPLFAKLNLKLQDPVHVLGAPASFDAELQALQGSGGPTVLRQASGTIAFALAFAVTQAELDAACVQLVAQAADDAVLWLAYPKGTSRRYRCEFKRDSGWTVFGDAGYEPVRMVAVDEDWSALRFCKADRIKLMKRDPASAISPAGKRRAAAAQVGKAGQSGNAG